MRGNEAHHFHELIHVLQWQVLGPKRFVGAFAPVWLRKQIYPNMLWMVSVTSDNDEPKHLPGVFVTTQWTCILQAKENSTVALENLCAVYRPALLTWLRSRGEDPHRIEDLIQGFFEHLLKKSFLANVAREKGRFRTFLLAALQNFLADQHRHAVAKKRGSGAATASLEEGFEENNGALEPRGALESPDAAFDRAWAETVLANSLRELEGECARSGHAQLCQTLEPVLFADEDAPAYAQIASELGMTEAAVKMAAMRIRQRLKRIIRDEVLRTVADERELDTELNYLKTLFAKTSSFA